MRHKLLCHKCGHSSLGMVHYRGSATCETCSGLSHWIADTAVLLIVTRLSSLWLETAGVVRSTSVTPQTKVGVGFVAWGSMVHRCEHSPCLSVSPSRYESL